MSSCILLDIYPTFPLAKNKKKISWAPWAISCDEEPGQQAWFEARQKEEETWTASEMEEERDRPQFLPQLGHLATRRRPRCLPLRPWRPGSQQLTTANTGLPWEQTVGWQL